jgi:hypothetical protein
MKQTSETNEIYLRLTDGDMDYSEYLECLPIQVEQCINQTTTKPPEYSPCIKCSYTRKRMYGYCIIRS